MKNIITLLIIVVLAVIVLALTGFFKTESGSNATSTATTTNEVVVLAEGLEVSQPVKNQKVISPISMAGRATGSWFFEATFPVDLVVEGNVISQGYVTAEGEWMTTEKVPFSGSLTFVVDKETKAELVFKKDNPSGLPENDMSARLPVILIPSDTREQTVKVFFTTGDGTDCSEVAAIERSITPTKAVAQAALTELIGGPTPTEEAQGFSSVIPNDTRVNSIRIEDKTAYVDFNSALNTIAGSCAVTAARSQITETIKQFSTVDKVVISVEGDSDTALQP